MSYQSLTPLNAPFDVGPHFYDPNNQVFVAKRLSEFDTTTQQGRLTWDRHRWKLHFGFNHMGGGLEIDKGNEFPGIEYEVHPTLPFSIQFVSQRSIRLRLRTSTAPFVESESLMLVKNPPTVAWRCEKSEKAITYTSEFAQVKIQLDPWQIDICDARGKVLTSTRTATGGKLPFSFVRRASDYSRSVAANFLLSPGEKIMGYGEWFGPLDKRGQRLVLSTTDCISAERPVMYKPIPFFLSNRGYGMFIHTSSPITADVGAEAFSNHSIMVGDDALDLFIFVGEPKDILDEYTNLVGKPAMPPLWSFGLWMSRITYKSEEEVRTVTSKLRENRVPCDVIHLDTGWFQTDWRCDYQFSKDRFADAKKMIDDLKKIGFQTCLWQLPYFVPKNELFNQIVEQGMAVRDPKGGLPGEDAILDFSNPKTVRWYQDKLAGLLKLGVGAIKTDFGEAAPYNGQYASGRTGFYEHNLYPLRYQKAVADVTREVTGGDVIWARAGWAGSQRYPLHWSGDSNGTDGAMAGTLRAGLSLGVCGFTFWSHDIGGFFGRPNVELYRRWAAFGLFTSHSRCHGDPPREPWEYGDEFQNDFRAIVEAKYRLLPYLYAQSKDSATRGLPMLRALFVEFPDDPGSWRVDDQYLLGSSLLVAPLFEAGTKSRDVYLPPGEWIDYQTAKHYAGGTWHRIEAGPLPIILLVRAGTILPRVQVAQSTDFVDWKNIELLTFPDSTGQASGIVFLPGQSSPTRLRIEASKPTQVEASSELPVRWQVKVM